MASTSMRLQGRRKRSGDYVMVPISMPKHVAEVLTRRAKKRSDSNRSAEATEIIAGHYGISIDGGESPEKQQIPA
jgi:hypothetical protein